MKARNKAAIITLYGEFNYGNRLQNYAIDACFRAWGYDSQTIVVKVSKGLKTAIKMGIKQTAAHLFPHTVTQKHPDWVRDANFKHFTRKHIPTRYVDKGMVAELAQEYDLFSVGSDQVWNPCFGGYETMFDQMLLTFVPSEKKRCFSPSFGISEMPEEWKDRFSEALSSFPHLCAREDDGARLIKVLTGTDAAVTVDPTLMLDAEDWLQVAKKVERLPKHYALDYFLGKTPENDPGYSFAGAGKERLRLLDLSQKNVYTSGPGEFIYLISQADVVCTDSFHACVFSILFSKPLVVFKRCDENSDMFSRMETLFSLFGLDINEHIGEIIRIDDEIRDNVLMNKRRELKAYFCE